MGLIERIDHKLTLIALALGVTLTDDLTAGAVLDTVGTGVSGVGFSAVTDTNVQSEAAPQTATLPVKRLTVKEALAAKQPLTGNELDEQGCYWSAELNAKKPAVTRKNIWKRGQSIDDAVYDAGIAKIKAEVAAESAVNTTSVVGAAGGIPKPGTTANTGIPKPGAAAGGIPKPGAAGSNPAADPHNEQRRRILNIIKVLEDDYNISFESQSLAYKAFGSPTGMFGDFPHANYNQLEKVLNNWCIILDRIEENEKEILAMNDNDQTFLLDIMNGLQLGTTDVSQVVFSDLPKLSKAVHDYLNLLENHFGKPVTQFTTVLME